MLCVFLNEADNSSSALLSQLQHPGNFIGLEGSFVGTPHLADKETRSREAHQYAWDPIGRIEKQPDDVTGYCKYLSHC